MSIDHLPIVTSNTCLGFKTFVTQCEEDYELLNHCLNDSNDSVLKKDGKINIWFRPKVDHSGPPMDDEEVCSTAIVTGLC